MGRPDTPKDLEAAGYRIETAQDETFGPFWWTWTVDGCASVDASREDWPTPAQAIADARADLAHMNSTKEQDHGPAHQA